MALEMRAAALRKELQELETRAERARWELERLQAEWKQADLELSRLRDGAVDDEAARAGAPDALEIGRRAVGRHEELDESEQELRALLARAADLRESCGRREAEADGLLRRLKVTADLVGDPTLSAFARREIAALQRES